MKPITLMEIKQALRDKRFQDSLPSDIFQEDLQKYMKNPGCACNTPFYKKIMTQATEQVQAYFPNRSIANLQEEAKKLAENHWKVINCHVDELEELLKKLPPGRKQLAITRFEDQVTAVVNELDAIF